MNLSVSGVDLVIEFQVDQDVAAIIGDKIAGAGIPLIAVDIPHPHAVFFGVDNFRVGFEAGKLLARHAQQNWAGKPSWVLGLDLAEAGPAGAEPHYRERSKLFAPISPTFRLKPLFAWMAADCRTSVITWFWIFCIATPKTAAL